MSLRRRRRRRGRAGPWVPARRRGAGASAPGRLARKPPLPHPRTPHTLRKPSPPALPHSPSACCSPLSRSHGPYPCIRVTCFSQRGPRTALIPFWTERTGTRCVIRPSLPHDDKTHPLPSLPAATEKAKTSKRIPQPTRPRKHRWARSASGAASAPRPSSRRSSPFSKSSRPPQSSSKWGLRSADTPCAASLRLRAG